MVHYRHDVYNTLKEGYMPLEVAEQHA